MAILSCNDNNSDSCICIKVYGGNLMGRKVFVSYKYKDSDVESLAGVAPPTWPCDYVNYIKDFVLDDDDIYKGENSDEDISSWDDDDIWDHLRDKIYDSTITIVLISPNMKESGKLQSSQWIPWEISYSLRETTRNDRTSHNNAILAVILPDKTGSYDYYDKDDLFPILKDNIDNGYIYVVTWEDFKKYPNADISQAFDYRARTPSDRIKKSL